MGFSALFTFVDSSLLNTVTWLKMRSAKVDLLNLIHNRRSNKQSSNLFFSITLYSRVKNTSFVILSQNKEDVQSPTQKRYHSIYRYFRNIWPSIIIRPKDWPVTTQNCGQLRSEIWPTGLSLATVKSYLFLEERSYTEQDSSEEMIFFPRRRQKVRPAWS